MGIEGEHLQFDAISLQNEALEELIKRILPLCQNFINIDKYIQTNSLHDRGLIQHSFSFSLKEILQVIKKNSHKESFIVHRTVGKSIFRTKFVTSKTLVLPSTLHEKISTFESINHRNKRFQRWKVAFNNL
jgi:hypothetical protein